MTMQQAARAIITARVFLYTWLRDEHIKTKLVPAIKLRAKDYLDV